MPNLLALILGVFLLSVPLATPAWSQASNGPQTVVVRNGSITLHGLLWRPQGRGPFPAVLLNHGSGRTREDLARLGPYEASARVLGPVFARHGYVFLYLFRRGVGLSADQGPSSIDMMTAAQAARGLAGRNALQLKLLETSDMSDAMSGLALLRSLPDVDAHDIALVGHSFGGSLTLLMAEREPDLRAVVVFSGAGYSWDRSALLRARLRTAVSRIHAPLFFIHAKNDYSMSGAALDALLRQLHKPHRLKIYPPVGRTLEDGHSMLYLAVGEWEPDVFAFLDKYMSR